MSWLVHPAFFNWLIVALLAAAAIRWAFAGNWSQSIYWAAGAVLNVAVIFMGNK